MCIQKRSVLKILDLCDGDDRAEGESSKPCEKLPLYEALTML